MSVKEEKYDTSYGSEAIEEHIRTRTESAGHKILMEFVNKPVGEYYTYSYKYLMPRGASLLCERFKPKNRKHAEKRDMKNILEGRVK